MRNIRRKFCVLVSIIMMVCQSSNVLAADSIDSLEHEVLVYEETDGTKIEYYFGTDGNAYMNTEEEILLALPLEQFRVNDENLIQSLNDRLASNVVSLTSAPTTYVDLSNCSATAASSVYSKSIDFSGGAVNTDVLKINLQHCMVRLATTDIVKNTFFTGKNITYIFYYYNYIDECWYSLSAKTDNCDVSTGKAIRITEGLYPYVYYNIDKSSDLASLTAKIWTTPWSAN